MPLRKMKAKKFKGIYEYYRASDHDKATVAYYITVRGADGKSRKVKTDATTPQEAVIALAHYKATRTTQTSMHDAKLTLSSLAADFFEKRSTKDNKRDRRKYELHIDPILGTLLASKISKRDIMNLQSHLQQKKVPLSKKVDSPLIDMTPKTINNITDLASRIMKWGYDHELIPTPLPKIEKLRIDNERQRVFTKEELDTIFDATEGDTRLFLLLAYYTAQRPQSIINLKKKHILNGSILVESIKHQSSHLVPISTKLAEALYPWIEHLDSDDYIITKSPTPMPYQTIQARISKLFGKLFNHNLDYRKDTKQWASLYTLRHTALTNIYAHTSDIYAAQSIANHSSVQMTQRYAKRSETLKRNAVEGL